MDSFPMTVRILHKLTITAVALAAFHTALFAEAKPEFAFTRLEDGVQLHVGEVAKTVTFYTPAMIRVNANLGRSHTQQPSLAVVAQPIPVAFRVEETPESLAIISDKPAVASKALRAAFSTRAARS
jgi:hypothetical protein